MKNPEKFNPFGRRGGPHGRGGGGRGHPMHGEGRGPGGRRRKQFDGDALRVMVVDLIGSGTAHGYDLIRAFSERSGGSYAPSPGMIYPLITLLAELGLVDVAGDGARKSLSLTEAGHAERAENADAADRLFKRLDALAERAARLDPTPVRRAMMNLKTVLMDRLGRDDASEETIFAAVEKIDAVAREIERL